MGAPIAMGQGGGMYLPPPGGMGYGMGMGGMPPSMGGMAPGMYYPNTQQPPQQAVPAYGQTYGSSYAGGGGSNESGGGRGGRGGIRQTPSGYASQAAGIVAPGGGYVGHGGAGSGGYASAGGSAGGYGASNNGQPVLEQITPPMYTSQDGNVVTMTMGVPDHLIGSILGKGGENVKEIMRISGSNVSISQKDNYLPGNDS